MSRPSQGGLAASDALAQRAEDRVQVVEGDVTRTGLPRDSFEAVVRSDRAEGWLSRIALFTVLSRQRRPTSCGEESLRRVSRAATATAI